VSNCLPPSVRMRYGDIRAGLDSYPIIMYLCYLVDNLIIDTYDVLGPKDLSQIKLDAIRTRTVLIIYFFVERFRSSLFFQ
jgi:hypothetical protein